VSTQCVQAACNSRPQTFGRVCIFFSWCTPARLAAMGAGRF
jgi:hypothetical protein